MPPVAASTPATVHALLKPFVDICLLRLRPQDLPASGVLLGIALAAHVVSSVLLSAFQIGAGPAMLAGVAETALLCALTASLLHVQRLGARTLQTLTAMAGSGAVIGLAAVPIYLWMRGVAAPGQGSVAVYALLALLAWSLVVAAHVLRHALSVSFFLGLVLAVVFYWISVSVLTTAFPPPA